MPQSYRSKVLKVFLGLVVSLAFCTVSYAQNLGYESKFANVNGVRIHYLKAGTGKKALVLIHGFGDNAHMWIPLFKDLGKDWTTVLSTGSRARWSAARPRNSAGSS